MKSLNIDLTKIEGVKLLEKDGRTFIEITKASLYVGKKGGRFLSITLHDNKDGRDDYGNDGFASQDIGKERREAGEKGPILGNWKELGGQKRQGSSGQREGRKESQKEREQRDLEEASKGDEDLPF